MIESRMLDLSSEEFGLGLGFQNPVWSKRRLDMMMSYCMMDDW